MRSSPSPRIGIDLGGTKIEAIVLSNDGSIEARYRTDTPKNNYVQTLNAINHVIDFVSDRQNLPESLPIGIGTPGAVSLHTGLMMNCNSTCLNGKPLPPDLEALIRRPVRLANDADCFALSEASDGAGKSGTLVFGVILGTGVGGGFVFNHQLIQGVNAICGEWGHNPLPLDVYQPDEGEEFKPFESRECFCGRNNCVETWLAGPSFERSYQELTLQQLSSRQIVAAAMKGSPTAVNLLNQYCNLLALALSNVINILDPAVIVLGGGMANIDLLYEKLPHYLPRYVFSDQLNTRIVKAKYGDSSGVRGAAWLWPKPR